MDNKNSDIQSMMSSLMQNAQKMQDKLQKAYQEIAENGKNRIVEGKAGGNLVTAQVNLKMQVTHLELNPDLFKESTSVIAELIAAAVNQGIYNAQQTLKQEMSDTAKKMGIPSEFPMPFDRG